MIVPDASVLTRAFAVRTDEGRIARSTFLGRHVAIPATTDVEVMSAMRKMWLRGELDGEALDTSYGIYAMMPCTRYPLLPLMDRALELRHNLTPYDAAYVALAELLDCPLVTADRRMAAAPGVRCEVRVLA